MPPKNKKKGKRLEAEAATAQTDADFDDMLTEVMAVDVTISTGGSTSSSSTAAAAAAPPQIPHGRRSRKQAFLRR
jgi:hypothetical protein